MTAQEEQELVLRLSKAELFNPHVLLPHAELNETVYQSVNTFVEKYRSNQMMLTIFTEPVNPVVQNAFRETFRAHYEDEVRKLNRYLMRRSIRFLFLFAISLCAFILAEVLTRRLTGYSILLNILANIGAFCLWEVGYTHFAARSMVDEKKRMLRAMNATIEFH